MNLRPQQAAFPLPAVLGGPYRLPTVKLLHRLASLTLALAWLGSLTPLASAQVRLPVEYPPTKRIEQVDEFFGERVADPYRWLEDENGAETARWVEVQNVVTFAYLDQIPYRPRIKSRLETLFDYPKFTPPARRGDYFYFTKNDGLQNQFVWYRQKGLEGAAEVLFDPNKLSADGT